MGVWGSRVLGVTAVALTASLAGAGSASAQDERFAEPGGTGPAATCPEAAPCSLTDAVENGAVADDDVVTLLPGDTGGVYETQTSPLEVTDAITLRSRESDPVPMVPITLAPVFPPGVFVNAAATLRRLRFEYGNATGRALDLLAANAVLDRVFVKGPGTACGILADTAVITDSVCWSHDNGNALGFEAPAAGSVSRSAQLVNVTVVGENPGANGIFVDAEADQNMTINAVNTIAFGESDVFAKGEGDDAVATVNLQNSNYDSRLETAIGMGATASVTEPGTGTNLLPPPAFVSPPSGAAGDFHQLPSSSATIDLGTTATTPPLGALDLDGDSRTLGSAPDIGADEFVPPAPPPPQDDGADTGPPDTTISDGPSGKTKKKTATISFSGTDARAVASFECRLDSGPFQPCTSPATFSKLKKGNHTVEVRAVDTAGNVDPTPATRGWKVKKKKKKR